MKFVSLTRDTILSLQGDIAACHADQDWPAYTVDQLLADLPRKWDMSFVAVGDRNVMGFCIASDKPPVHIHRFAVFEGCRGAAIGRLMFEELVRRAGAGPMTLKVDQDNDRGVAFWHERGFTRCTAMVQAAERVYFSLERAP